MLKTVSGAAPAVAMGIEVTADIKCIGRSCRRLTVKSITMTPRFAFVAGALIVTSLTGCGKKDAIAELEKSAASLEKSSKDQPAAPVSGDYDPAVGALVPAKEVKEAIAEYKAGKMEDAVTRLQLLRSQTTVTPEQRVALQDSIASLMAEIYAQAEKGDARARAAVVQWEKMQTMRR